MHYLGLVPSENSSGQARRQGAITKTGSRHARRLLVEAAWHYRRPPRKGTTLQRRQQDQPAQTIAISWKAQQRLHHIWHRLDTQRGKRKTLVAVAVARHLTGFCWAITNSDPNSLTQDQPHDPRLRGRQNPPGTLHAREHPRLPYEQPPRRPRSILDSGLSRRNPGLRYPTREYQSDQTSRTRQACRPLSRAPAKPTLEAQPLTNQPPYQPYVPWRDAARA